MQNLEVDWYPAFGKIRFENGEVFYSVVHVYDVKVSLSLRHVK